MLTKITRSALVLGAGLAVALSSTAGADTRAQGNLAKDGSLWLVQKSGHVCRVYTTQNLSASTCLNANLVRVENHGYTAGVGGKSNARLYYNQSFQNGGRSAYACISPQSVWKRSAGGVSVDFNQLNHPKQSSAGTGINVPIWHQVARVEWTSAPCV